MEKMRSTEELRALAKAIRKDILDMTFHAGTNGAHIGGALSSADILAVLYGKVLRVSPDNPTDPSRDRFFLSKGHAALALYAVLAECGFLSRDEMMSFEARESDYQTHTVMNLQKGIEISSGSLGWGLSIGVGSSLAAKRKGNEYRVFVLLGDGECNEGSVWEAAMSAARFSLDNLTVIVDVNAQQGDGYSEDIMPVCDMPEVFRGFGFHVIEVDGHDISQLSDAFCAPTNNRPTAILAHTLKGKGVASIEGKAGWHHTILTQEQYDAFIHELEDS